MKNITYQIIKIASLFMAGLIFILIIYRLISYNYNVKFKNVAIGTHIVTIKKKWGNPDTEFIYKELDNSIVYKYKKDPLGWDTYIFIFSPKDSLLIGKNIDD